MKVKAFTKMFAAMATLVLLTGTITPAGDSTQSPPTEGTGTCPISFPGGIYNGLVRVPLMFDGTASLDEPFVKGFDFDDRWSAIAHFLQRTQREGCRRPEGGPAPCGRARRKPTRPTPLLPSSCRRRRR